MRTKRFSLVVASLALVGGMTAACGGGSGADAPTNASQDDFCEAYMKITEVTDADGAKDVAKDLADIGTPEGISDEARKGFEVYVDALEDADDGDTETPWDDDEQENVTAFLTWASTTCVQMPSGTETE
ncbi:hypothetical protein [Nocardioides sp. AE5]|uniref:hypothetical protein n=1 Tax=Nocardioides sp. AE5 TaxID=2962573 RepID=UPI0028813D89|nr:hypothetical protein [Nocardioides sp. AE5]MDT0202328.1 hypothetical protein [Nocardioides sp. AE5]